MELCDMTASELLRMLKKGSVNSVEILRSVLKRTEEREPSLNCFITRTGKTALDQAEEADRRMSLRGDIPPLNGIPVAVKDNLCTRGIRTTCGSKILYNYIPPYNATCVEKIFDQGAIMVGKTNLDEFGMGSSTENSAFGPTRNPLNPDFVAGGSSGGSAAAVASGEAVLALGTDTGGSIRLPAAFCGIVGIKPTYGRVSRYGLVSYASSLDQVGALGRSVEDCGLLLNAVCGKDPRDSTSVELERPDFLDSIKKGVRGVRIGLPKEYFVEGMNSGVRDNILKAVEGLEREGARIVDISLPHTKYAISSYYLIATAEASSNLARYDGVRYGFRAGDETSDLLEMYEATRSEGFGNEVKRRIILGSYVLSAGYYDAYYIKAQETRRLINNDFERAFDKVDCLITPVSPFLPFRLGEKIEEPLQMYLVDIYTVSVNLCGLPGMSINCGKSEGLPVGFQIIGKPFDENMVLRVGRAHEIISKANTSAEV